MVSKLSQMILDHKLSGILDEGKGFLILYETHGTDTTFTQSQAIIGHLHDTIAILFDRAKNLQSDKNTGGAGKKKDKNSSDNKGKESKEGSKENNKAN